MVQNHRSKVNSDTCTAVHSMDWAHTSL